MCCLNILIGRVFDAVDIPAHGIRLRLEIVIRREKLRVHLPGDIAGVTLGRRLHNHLLIGGLALRRLLRHRILLLLPLEHGLVDAWPHHLTVSGLGQRRGRWRYQPFPKIRNPRAELVRPVEQHAKPGCHGDLPPIGRLAFHLFLPQRHAAHHRAAHHTRGQRIGQHPLHGCLPGRRASPRYAHRRHGEQIGRRAPEKRCVGVLHLI